MVLTTAQAELKSAIQAVNQGAFYYILKPFANDELVVDYGTARFLTGTPAARYHSIRVNTSDPAALSSFLRSFGASVWISGAQGFISGVDTQTGLDPRLVNVLLRQGAGVLPPDYLSQALGETTDSVRVVAAVLGVLPYPLVVLRVSPLPPLAFARRPAAVRGHPHLARRENGQHGLVARQDTDLTLGGARDDHGCGTAPHLVIRRDEAHREARHC